MEELRVRVHSDLQTSTMSVVEAASVLDMSPDDVWRHLRAGDLAHIRVQGAEAIEYRILARDVVELQERLHGSDADAPKSAGAADPAAPTLLKRVPHLEAQGPGSGVERADKPIVEPRASRAAKRSPAKSSPQTPSTVTFSASAAPIQEPEADQPVSDTGVEPSAASLDDAGAAEPAQSLNAVTQAATVPPAAPAAVTTAAVEPPKADAADARPKRLALPPINSIVTVTGSAVHRIGHSGFDESDMMRMLQSFMESLVAPINAANERLADENSRLLELARMQSQALEKASAERDVLMERLAILPAEMQKLYERLGSLQAEVSRLEQENLSHRSATQQGASSDRSSWWRRLFNIE